VSHFLNFTFALHVTGQSLNYNHHQHMRRTFH